MIRHNERVFVIHPLPDRFGIQSHIIYEMNQPLFNSTDQIMHSDSGGDLVDDSNVNEVKNRMKRRISATEKIPQVLHIETAIFVDKDLYKHMVTNFGNDTESQIIRFVLALVNGVGGQWPQKGPLTNNVTESSHLSTASNCDLANRICKWEYVSGSTFVSSSLVGISNKFCAQKTGNIAQRSKRAKKVQRHRHLSEQFLFVAAEIQSRVGC